MTSIQVSCKKTVLGITDKKKNQKKTFHVMLRITKQPGFPLSSYTMWYWNKTIVESVYLMSLLHCQKKVPVTCHPQGSANCTLAVLAPWEVPQGRIFTLTRQLKPNVRKWLSSKNALLPICQPIRLAKWNLGLRNTPLGCSLFFWQCNFHRCKINTSLSILRDVEQLTHAKISL